jgi:hypothetical protein
MGFNGRHTLSLLPVQIIQIEDAATDFEPAEFVTWSPRGWFVPRDWGAFS